MWEIEKLHADHKQVYVHVATASYRYLYLLDPSIDIPSHAPMCLCTVRASRSLSLPPSPDPRSSCVLDKWLTFGMHDRLIIGPSTHRFWRRPDVH